MVNPAVLELVDSLSEDEQVELIHHVYQSWDLDSMPLTPEVMRLLDERLHEMEDNPESVVPAEEFMAEMRAR